jgi:hypothetical protein
MPQKLGLAESFAHFGATGKNRRWSWSAKSADGKTVVMALWKDGFDYSSQPIAYDTINRKNLPAWISRAGNRERLEYLMWARVHCNGIFKVVVVVAKDEKAEPRKIAECFPQDKMTMKITDLNELTGEFRAVLI